MVPVAQSFFINGEEYPSGVILTKVHLFFESIATDNSPVEVHVRVVENGIPDETPLPDSKVILFPSDISVPSNKTDLTTVRNTPTVVRWEEPVYLSPGKEYALVVASNSTEYYVYTSTVFDFLLGSTQAKSSKQPASGVFFRSSNGRTWSEDQKTDLMFELFIGAFSSTGTAYLYNADPGELKLFNDPIQTFAGDSEVRVFHEGHGYSVNDYVYISGLAAATNYGGIPGSALIGSRRILEVDHTGYKIAADNGNQATQSVFTGGDGVVATYQAMANQILPSIQSLIPIGTNVGIQLLTTPGASYAGVGSEDRNSALNTTYGSNLGYKDASLNNIFFSDVPVIIGNDSNETYNNGGNSTLITKLTFTTNDSDISPIIDLQRSSIVTFENIIDRQDSSLTDGYNQPIVYIAETEPTQGSSAAKYITKIVTLPTTAYGLKVILFANRPSAASIDVYYRAGGVDDTLTNIPWTLSALDVPVPSNENRNIYERYEYLIGGLGGSMSAFTQFQVKLVMNSTNSSKIPTIKSMRAIALGV